MSQTESVGSPVTQELVPQGAAGAEPPDAALVNDPSFKCGFHLFDSAGKPWHRPSCTFPCCIVPLSAGSDDSRKWQRTLAAEDSDSVSTNLSPPPGPDTRKRLLMDTPPEGWDAYYAAHHADKRNLLRLLGRAVSSPMTSPSHLLLGSQTLTVKECAASGSYTCHRCVGTVGRLWLRWVCWLAPLQPLMRDTVLESAVI